MIRVEQYGHHPHPSPEWDAIGRVFGEGREGPAAAGEDEARTK